MGGGGSRSAVIVPPSPPENQYLTQLADMSSGLWGEAGAIRTPYTKNILLPIVEGNYNPETLPTFAPQYDLLRGSLEGQYSQAKQNILASTPRGGALEGALAQLEYDRARNTGLGASQLSANILGDALNKAYNFGYVTGPQMSLGGMGTAANINQQGISSDMARQLQAQLANAQMSQSGGGKSGLTTLGTGIGALAGLAMAPFTGGSSLIGTGLSGVSSGLSSLGNKGGGVTSGLGGYSNLMASANPLSW